jgi:hypothetical protein
MPALCWFVSVLSSQRQTRQAGILTAEDTYLLRQALSINISRQEHVVNFEEAVCRFRSFACLRRMCTCTVGNKLQW